MPEDQTSKHDFLSPEETDDILLYSLKKCGDLTEQRVGYLVKILEILLQKGGKILHPLYRFQDSLENLTHIGTVVPINSPLSIAYHVLDDAAAKPELKMPEQSINLINSVLDDICVASDDYDVRKLFVACFASTKIDDQNIRIDYMEKSGIQRDVAIKTLKKYGKLVEKSSKTTLEAYR